MGCFSFLCKKCGKAILSNSFSGQKVKLFLLKDGEVIEKMEGKYDSYGRVFSKDIEGSLKWKIDWKNVCNLMFREKRSNGIAAIHLKCFNGEIPCERSYDDPNQGWGDDREFLGNSDPFTKFE